VDEASTFDDLESIFNTGEEEITTSNELYSNFLTMPDFGNEEQDSRRRTIDLVVQEESVFTTATSEAFGSSPIARTWDRPHLIALTPPMKKRQHFDPDEYRSMQGMNDVTNPSAVANREEAGPLTNRVPNRRIPEPAHKKVKTSRPFTKKGSEWELTEMAGRAA